MFCFVLCWKSKLHIKIILSTKCVSIKVISFGLQILYQLRFLLKVFLSLTLSFFISINIAKLFIRHTIYFGAV